MPVLTEFPGRRTEIGALARVVEEESDRLCAIIDNVRSTNRQRDEALMELRQLANNVLLCLEGLESRLDSNETSDRYNSGFAFESAA